MATANKLCEMRSRISTETAAMIPPAVLESLIAYAELGVPTGDFLRAVLENKLVSAIGRADQYSFAAIKPICSVLYWSFPTSIWGSPEAVEAHLERGQRLRESLQHDDR